MKKEVLVLLAVFFVSFVLAMNSTGYAQNSSVVSGGGSNATSGNYKTAFTVGEITGDLVSATYKTFIGFWQGGATANSVPTIELLSPADGNSTPDRTPTFSYLGHDLDGDELDYDINITCVSCSADNRYIENYSDTNYTPVDDLRYLYDNGYHYEWYVRACETSTPEMYCSDWAGPRAINITAQIILNLTNDVINFGSMEIGETKNTTDDSLEPFAFENIGNCYINVSLNSTHIWESIDSSPSSYYQSKVGDAGGNATWTNTTWKWLPPSEVQTIVSKLNYSVASNSLVSHILLEVPLNELSGKKNSTVIFQASLGE